MPFPLSLAFVAIAGFAQVRFTAGDARIVSLLDRSNYVFAGTIARTNASNLKTLKAAPNLAVVHVDTLLTSPAELRSTAGRDITIQLANPQTMTAGRSALFYTNVGAIGSTLGVVEVDHDDPAVGAKVRKELPRYEQLTSDLRLTRRLDAADFVVSGTVVRTRPAEIRERSVSEHAPNWWIATIEVRTVEKAPAGTRPQTIEVAFPKSDDEHWMYSPKFAEGDSGVWILRRTEKFLTALDPLDFQPLSQLDRIRALLKQPVRVATR